MTITNHTDEVLENQRWIYVANAIAGTAGLIAAAAASFAALAFLIFG